MRFLAIPLLLAVSSASFAQNSIEGRWKVTAQRMPATVKVTANFTKGKMSMLMLAPQGKATAKVQTFGTYTYKSGTLSSKFTDAKLDAIGLTPAQRKQMMSPEVQSKMKQSILRGTSPAGTIKFLGKDKFELKDKKGSVSTFTRIK